MSVKSWRDGIDRKKWAGKQDLRTLLWTLKYPGKVLVKYQSSVHQVSVTCRSSIGDVLVMYWLSIGHASVQY